MAVRDALEKAGMKTLNVELGEVQLAERPSDVQLQQIKDSLTQLGFELIDDRRSRINLFSETEGLTIEKYFIAQKIEKIKELLMYDELSLSQIADHLGYSSVAYLSNQFKKETGLTPSFYKNLRQKNRRNIEEL